MNGEPGRRGMRGAAGDAGIRQVRRAGPEIDSVERKAKAIGRDLRQRRRAPCPMSWAPVSITPVPSARTTARGYLEHQRRNVAVPIPQPWEAGVITHLPRGKHTPLPAKRSAPRA
jgi:hypothetical protein